MCNLVTNQAKVRLKPGTGTDSPLRSTTDLSIFPLGLEPPWDPLRNDPRFRALLEMYE